MGKEKAIVKISSTSLERVSKQISIVDKILLRRQIRISPTRNTPEVILDRNGIIKIRGRSIPERAFPIFIPIEDWVSGYILNPAEVTCVDINLEFLNGASKKFLVHIMQKITYVSLRHKKFIFNWYYEEGDIEILEIGEDLASILDVPFNFIKLK